MTHFNYISTFQTAQTTKNPLINSTIVFYSPIPTTYFLPHQKTLIRTEVTTYQTFKATRTLIRTSESTNTPYSCTCTCHARHSIHYSALLRTHHVQPTASVTMFLTLYLHVGTIFLPNMVRDEHTTNRKPQIIMQISKPTSNQ